MHRYAVECRRVRGSLEDTVRQGVEQTLDYMDRCGAPEGHLVVFDRDGTATWEDRLFRRKEAIGGRTVTVWGA